MDGIGEKGEREKKYKGELLFHLGRTIRIAETHFGEKETCRGIRVKGRGGGHHIAEPADQSRDLHTPQIFI